MVVDLFFGGVFFCGRLLLVDGAFSGGGTFGLTGGLAGLTFFENVCKCVISVVFVELALDQQQTGFAK